MSVRSASIAEISSSRIPSPVGGDVSSPLSEVETADKTPSPKIASSSPAIDEVSGGQHLLSAEPSSTEPSGAASALQRRGGVRRPKKEDSTATLERQGTVYTAVETGPAGRKPPKRQDTTLTRINPAATELFVLRHEFEAQGWQSDQSDDDDSSISEEQNSPQPIPDRSSLASGTESEIAEDVFGNPTETLRKAGVDINEMRDQRADQIANTTSPLLPKPSLATTAPPPPPRASIIDTQKKWQAAKNIADNMSSLLTKHRTLTVFGDILREYIQALEKTPSNWHNLSENFLRDIEGKQGYYQMTYEDELVTLRKQLNLLVSGAEPSLNPAQNISPNLSAIAHNPRGAVASIVAAKNPTLPAARPAATLDRPISAASSKETSINQAKKIHAILTAGLQKKQGMDYWKKSGGFFGGNPLDKAPEKFLNLLKSLIDKYESSTGSSADKDFKFELEELVEQSGLNESVKFYDMGKGKISREPEEHPFLEVVQAAIREISFVAPPGRRP